MLTPAQAEALAALLNTQTPWVVVETHDGIAERRIRVSLVANDIRILPPELLRKGRSAEAAD